jgi:hypothetical protein
MTNEMLTEVACPNCLNPIDVREHGRHITCDACSSQFILHGHLCPNCSTYNKDEASLCGQCGAALTRICRKCTTVNWAGDEYCRQCNNAMDILDLIAGNYQMKTSDRLLEQRLKAQEIKDLEETASIKRMEEFMAIEKERQDEIRYRLKAQKEIERTGLIIIALIIGSLFIALILLSIIN